MQHHDDVRAEIARLASRIKELERSLAAGGVDEALAATTTTTTIASAIPPRGGVMIQTKRNSIVGGGLGGSSSSSGSSLQPPSAIRRLNSTSPLTLDHTGRGWNGVNDGNEQQGNDLAFFNGDMGVEYDADRHSTTAAAGALSRSTSSSSSNEKDDNGDVSRTTTAADGTVMTTVNEGGIRMSRTATPLDLDAASSRQPHHPRRRAQIRLMAHLGDDTEEFEPEASIIRIPAVSRHYVELFWKEKPRLALIIRKPGDMDTLVAMREAVDFLWGEGIAVLVETGGEGELSRPPRSGLLHHAALNRLSQFPVDFIVCFGGDGTFIRASLAFPQACPPLLAFALGSLGFLTPFPASMVKESLSYLLAGKCGLRLRARLDIELTRETSGGASPGAPDRFTVLNEAVIDRGASTSMVQLVLYSNRDGALPVTTIQGDGLILATPTGSTAYSLSAGGSMVHPSVSAVLVTPICPHSLSFRPILVPDSATLRVQVAKDARNSAWISCDGRERIELRPGDAVICRHSTYPVPAVLPKRNEWGDGDGWLQSLRTALHWNVIQLQKPLPSKSVQQELDNRNAKRIKKEDEESGI